jgi:hypothetical protein
MTPFFTTEAYIGFSILLFAMAYSANNLSVMLEGFWEPLKLSKENEAKHTGTYFLLIMSGIINVIACFLGFLLSMFAASGSSAPTLGAPYTPEQAMWWMVGVGATSIFIAARSTYRLTKNVKSEPDHRVAITFINGAFVFTGTIWIGLSMVLALFAGGREINADYLLGAGILLGAVFISSIFGRMFRDWITKQIITQNADPGELEVRVKHRAFAIVALTVMPSIAAYWIIVT